MCADTDIRYVLNIIKKYEYKPEEYALHNGKLNKAEKKKAKPVSYTHLDVYKRQA